MNDMSEMQDLTVEDAHRTFGGPYIPGKIMLIDNLRLVARLLMPFRTKCLIFGLCTQGRAEYTVGLKKCVVEAGDCILIDESQMVLNGTSSPDMAGKGFIITKDFAHEVYQHLSVKSDLFFFRLSNPVFRLSQWVIDDFKTYFGLIRRKIDTQTTHPLLPEVVGSILQSLAYDLSCEFHQHHMRDPQQSTRADAICEQFVRLVEQNYRRERNVSWYSRQLCITAKYLSEAVRQSSGYTPSEWINNYVITEMRMLLKNTKMDIKEITHELNFANQSFFGKFFKKHVGMSPSEYRNS